MMYKSKRPSFQFSSDSLKTQRKVLLAVCAVLLAAAIVLGVFALRGLSYRNQIKEQFSQRMYSASNSAIAEVNSLGSIITSNAPARLARVRQYIYYMDQLNAMSVSLAGESGRLVDDAAFTALYSDLESFEEVLRQSTTSTIDIRTTLLTHLNALQTYLDKP